MPSANGPDLYSIETDGNGTPLLRGLTADGQQLWVTQFATGSYNYSVFGYKNAAMPDGNGGILIKLVANPGSYPQTFQIVDLDAQTGTQAWTYNAGYFVNPLTQEAAIRGDGTIFRLGASQGQYALLGLDPITGSTVSTYIVPAGSVTFTNCATVPGTRPMYNSVLSPPTVGPDGSAYSVVTKTDIAVWGCPAYTNYPPQSLNTLTQTVSLLQIAPDGTSSLTQLRQDSPRSSANDAGIYFEQDAGVYAFYQQVDLPEAAGFHVIPDGQGGSLVPYSFTWSSITSVPLWQQHVAHVSGGTVQYDSALPLHPTQNPQDFPMALGDTSTAYTTDGQTVEAFAVSTGQTAWSYTSSASGGIAILLAASGGGLVAKEFNGNGTETVVRFDSSGTATHDSWTGSAIDYWAGDLWPGSTGSLSVGYSAAPVQFSTSSWHAPNEFGSNEAAQNFSVTNFSQTGPNQTTITNGLQKILAALPTSSSCNNWLQGAGNMTGTSGLQWTQSLISANAFGHGTINLGTGPYFKTGAFSGQKNPDGTLVPGLPASPAPVFTVNDVGSFFNSSDSQGRQFSVGKRHYAGNTLRAQLEILIHEEGHQLEVSGFQHDAGIPKAGEANDELVDKYCRGLIEGPSIKSLSPSSGPVGTVVTITGQYFGAPQGASTIKFNNGIAGAVTTWTDTQIVVTVPSGATTGNIVITVGGANGQSASRNFTVQ